jgi:sugar O-acyltransferase (sialic acid O-acetyltransferase NeuD family)
MSRPFAIVGRGALFAVIREMLGDEGFQGFYDDRPSDEPHYLGPVASARPIDGGTVFVAIAALRNMLLREQLLLRLASGLGHSAVSSKAYQTPSAEVGNASVICPFACLHSNVRVGHGAVIFSGSVIEHDCIVGSNVNIGPGATIAGSVTIGDNVFIGAGVTIKDGVEIGRNSVVGAGSVVLRDIPPNMIAYGNPARVVRPNDLYLAV